MEALAVCPQEVHEFGSVVGVAPVSTVTLGEPYEYTMKRRQRHNERLSAKNNSFDLSIAATPTALLTTELGSIGC